MPLICITDKHRLSHTRGNQEKCEESNGRMFRRGSEDRFRSDGTWLLPQISTIWDVQDPPRVPCCGWCSRMTVWIYHTNAKTGTVWFVCRTRTPKLAPPPCGTSETSRRRKGAMVGNMLLISRQNDKKHKSDVLLKCQECFSTEGASCVDKEAAPSSPSGGFRSYSVGTTLSSFPGTSRRSFINCFAMSYNDFSNKKLPQPIGWGGLDTFLRGSWHRTILFQHQCLIATQMYNIKERNDLQERSRCKKKKTSTVVACVPHTKTVGITCNVITFNLNEDILLFISHSHWLDVDFCHFWRR